MAIDDTTYRWVKPGAAGPGAMRYGADYNPEQWPREVWDDDVRLMTEAGVNIVSLGIFSWALLEPRAGEYDFSWLDEVIDLLHANGIDVALATATASPPPWLAKAHPEILPVAIDGTVQEDRVVAATGGRDLGQHLRPDGAVPLDVGIEHLRPHVQGESDAGHDTPS